MNPILDLERAGYQFTLDGDSIRYTLLPGREVDPATVKPLLEQLKKHKPDAIAFLRQRDDLPLSLTGVDPGEVALAWSQLKHRGYFVMLSHALGEKIAIVEDEADRLRVPQGVLAYTFEEIRLLQQGVEAGNIVTIGDLRLLHSSKKRMCGAITRKEGDGKCSKQE